MTKELESLERVKNFLGFNYCSADLPNELKLIEQALQRLESIDNTESSEALGCLEYLYEALKWEYLDDNSKKITMYDEKVLNTIKNYILKTQEMEKVLNILIKRQVHIALLMTVDNIEEYNFYIPYVEFERYLTQEEFNLVRRYIDERYRIYKYFN